MLVVMCPHCGGAVEVLEINCRVFRHAIYKITLQPIPPHATQVECQRLIDDDAIYGCGKPFILVQQANGEWVPEVCDYI